MINTLIELLIIFCFLMMVIFGGGFVSGNKELSYLCGFLFFSIAAYVSLYFDEKRSKKKISGQTLKSKILTAFIGGSVFALILVYIYVNFGRTWAGAYFAVSSLVMHLISNKYIRANPESVTDEKPSTYQAPGRQE